MFKKLKNNKVLKFIFGFIKFIIWIILILMLGIIIIQKFFDDKVSLGGLKVFTVVSTSMVPEYEVGDIIITKKLNANELEVGDNVTYKGNKGQINGINITHKIVKKRSEEGVDYFTTRGVANEIDDPEITYSQIHGKVIYKTIVLSYISKLMTSLAGYYIIFTLVGILVSYQIINAINDRDEEDELEG